MANELTNITSNGNLKRSILLLGGIFGTIASAILILNYFQNRKFFSHERELAHLQEELIRLQIEQIKKQNGYQR